MTDPLAKAFDLFDERVQPSSAQRHGAELRGQHISHLMMHADNILACRPVGSLVRSTAVRRFSDVDILAVFDLKKTANSESSKALLDLTEQIVTPFDAAVIRTSTTISLRYPDWPNVDILPGWILADQGEETFCIPAGSNKSWQIYIPIQHESIVQTASKRLGSRFKKIIRAIKWWNGLNGGILNSFEIEKLVSDLFRAEIPQYAEAIFKIFDSMMRKLDDVNYNNCGQAAEARITDIVNDSRLLSLEARNIAHKSSSARELEFIFWRLFGDQFPLVCC